MSKLDSELQRLGWPADDPSGCAVPGRLAADGSTRCLAIDFARSADWPQAAALCRALADDLDLPAPAVSVSGSAGYRLWLALAEPTPAAEAGRFLAALCGKYLAEMPAGHRRCHPAAGPTAAPGLAVEAVPALDPVTGKWSAFIDPGLGEMFVAEAGLDMAPNFDRQADLLAGIQLITAADFRRALGALTTAEPSAQAAAAPRPAAGHYADPHSFLLAVINDPTASTADRIAAATALLPYFAGHASK